MSLFYFVACASFLSVALEKAGRISRKFRWLAPAHRYSVACAFLAAIASAPVANAQTRQYTDLGNGGYASSLSMGVSDNGSAAVVVAASGLVSNTGFGHSFLWMPRDNQHENPASIRMRMRRRLADRKEGLRLPSIPRLSRNANRENYF
jgi:hypothetical protein